MHIGQFSLVKLHYITLHYNNKYNLQDNNQILNTPILFWRIRIKKFVIIVSNINAKLS